MMTITYDQYQNEHRNNHYSDQVKYKIISNFNPLIAKRFPVFLRNRKSFYFKQNFSCSLILRTSFHKKIFQIKSAVLAVKLDKGGGGGGWQTSPPR